MHFEKFSVEKHHQCDLEFSDLKMAELNGGGFQSGVFPRFSPFIVFSVLFSQTEESSPNSSSQNPNLDNEILLYIRYYGNKML